MGASYFLDIGTAIVLSIFLEKEEAHLTGSSFFATFFMVSEERNPSELFESFAKIQ